MTPTLSGEEPDYLRSASKRVVAVDRRVPGRYRGHSAGAGDQGLRGALRSKDAGHLDGSARGTGGGQETCVTGRGRTIPSRVMSTFSL